MCLIGPTRFFAGLRASYEEEAGVGRALLFAGICGIVGLLLSFLAAPLDPLAPEDVPNPLFDFFSFAQDNPGSAAVYVVLFLVLAPIGVVLLTYVGALIQHLFVFLFVRERRGFIEATFLVVAYESAIFLATWVPVLGYLAFLYGIYVTAVGLRELHGTTTTRALLAALVPLLLFLVVSYLPYLHATLTSA